MRLALIILGAALLSSCATRPIQYTAPDAGKMNAAQAKLQASVAAAREAAGKARQSVTSADTSAKKVQTIATSLKGSLAAIHMRAAPSLRPLVETAQAQLESQLAEEGTLALHLTAAQQEQGQLDTQLATAEADRDNLRKEQGSYVVQANKLAIIATTERTSRIAVETKLSWYRWHWWGSWIALGAGVLACLGFAFLKFTGRLAIIGAKVAA